MALPTLLRPASVFETVTHPIHDIGRWARFALGSRLGAHYVGALGGNAHYNDVLLSFRARERAAHYREGAAAFVDILSLALEEAGHEWRDVRACLDAGCGYGRIVRELRRKLPPHVISVCDVNEEGARFTASEFGVRRLPVLEIMGPDKNGSFDLVYILSRYTHLDRAMIELNIAKTAALTKAGGVVVFTTHGEQSAELDPLERRFHIDGGALAAELGHSGYVHKRDPQHADDGLTWIVMDEVKKLVADVAPELQFVAHHPLAIDDHQDVYVYRRL